jgi:D-lactate dehydrogenase
MKKGALLVNTARGELIETDALVWALNEGIIGGAGLDVLEGERYMKNEMKNLSNDIVEPMEDAQGMKIVAENEALIHHPRVIVTPHVAFFSKEAKEEILKTTVENITGYLKGAVTNSVQVS